MCIDQPAQSHGDTANRRPPHPVEGKAMKDVLDPVERRRQQRGFDADHQPDRGRGNYRRSEEHTSELQSLMRISYAVFCLKKKKTTNTNNINQHTKKQNTKKHT